MFSFPWFGSRSPPPSRKKKTTNGTRILIESGGGGNGKSDSDGDCDSKSNEDVVSALKDILFYLQILLFAVCFLVLLAWIDSRVVWGEEGFTAATAGAAAAASGTGGAGTFEFAAEPGEVKVGLIRWVLGGVWRVFSWVMGGFWWVLGLFGVAFSSMYSGWSWFWRLVTFTNRSVGGGAGMGPRQMQFRQTPPRAEYDYQKRKKQQGFAGSKAAKYGNRPSPQAQPLWARR